jgi:deoxyribose-phosphate aldolase
MLRIELAPEDHMDYTYADIAKMIDHSLLRPFYTDAELEQGCDLALRYDVASVCIKPYAVKRAAAILAGSGVKATTTVGFPHGGHATAIKLAEAEQALTDGATELDMVINIGKALSSDWDYVCADIDAVVRAGHAAGALVKVIFENCYLQDEHKIRLCEICGEVGADWVKTSTGYGSGGAVMDDLRLMRKHAPAHVQVKAAGGITTLDLALEVRAIGGTRFGTLQTVEILEECKQRLGLA